MNLAFTRSCFAPAFSFVPLQFRDYDPWPANWPEHESQSVQNVTGEPRGFVPRSRHADKMAVDPRGRKLDLKIFKSLTSPVAMMDAAGNRVHIKKGEHPEQLEEEFDTEEFLRHLGVPVPESDLHYSVTGPVKMARFIEGLQPHSYQPHEHEQFRQHAAALAIAGVHDLYPRNVQVDPSGKLWFVDVGFGGARGGAMRQHPATFIAHASADPDLLFRGVTNEDVKAQLEALEPHIERALARVSNPAYRDALRKRYEMLLAAMNGAPVPQQSQHLPAWGVPAWAMPGQAAPAPQPPAPRPPVRWSGLRRPA